MTFADARNRTYAAKEIALFGAIDQLLSQGCKTYELKIGEIAAMAGIGKGTAYEYFPSKESLIRAAILYHICREYQRIAELVESDLPFRQAFTAGLDLVGVMMRGRLPSLMALGYALDQGSMPDLKAEDDALCQDIMQQADQLIDRFMERGVREGLIGAGTTVALRRFVLRGVVAAAVQMQQTDDRDTVYGFAWSTLQRALNP
jgi:AcrR family transcriptional regulator